MSINQDAHDRATTTTASMADTVVRELLDDMHDRILWARDAEDISLREPYLAELERLSEIVSTMALARESILGPEK